jgi:hypothetical protein
VTEQEELQAFLYRVTTANTALRSLVDEGTLREPPGEAAESSTGALEFFGLDERRAARRMGRVYELLCCFENSVRELIETTLKEALGPEAWLEQGVPESIRKEAESRRHDDEKARWHGPRGESLLNFVDFPELSDIIIERWDDFDDLLGDKNWVERYFDDINRSRRAIGHTGEMSEHAVARMELLVREWLFVVG